MKKKKKVNYDQPICQLAMILNHIASYINEKDNISFVNVEDVIFNDYLIILLEDIPDEFTQGYKRERINHFILKIGNERGAKIVSWLFKEKIQSLFETVNRKQKSRIDAVFVNVIKEVIWVSYYISTKPTHRLKLVGSPIDVLSRLQGVYLSARIPVKNFNSNKEEYITNIVSLKNTQYGFLPYPDHIDPIDLENLLIENNLMSDTLLWIIKGLKRFPFTPYERYHMFDFVRTIVKQKLERKNKWLNSR